MMMRRPLLLTPALCIVLVFGCEGGPSRPANVSGKVTLNGKPLPGGSIGFVFKDGERGGGEIEPDGTYDARQLPAGEASVFIDNEALKPAGKAPEKYGDKQGGSGSVSPAPKDRTINTKPKGEYVKIPDKYK